MKIEATGYVLTLDSGKQIELTSDEHAEIAAHFAPLPLRPQGVIVPPTGPDGPIPSAEEEPPS